MKYKGNWPVRLTAAGLVIVAMLGVAVAAGQQGSQSDPLVTLSYLEKKTTPAILSQVDGKIAQRESGLKTQLQTVVDGYVDEVEDKLAGGASGASASFQVVTLTQGQKLIGKEGCEFLLRNGTAVCVSDSAPGLVDMTAGSTLASGGALTVNHLYLGTIDGRGVQAKTNVTLLVRGSYTIS